MKFHHMHTMDVKLLLLFKRSRLVQHLARACVYPNVFKHKTMKQNRGFLTQNWNTIW
jgi:hypothetical protein